MISAAVIRSLLLAALPLSGEGKSAGPERLLINCRPVGLNENQYRRTGRVSQETASIVREGRRQNGANQPRGVAAPIAKRVPISKQRSAMRLQRLTFSRSSERPGTHS